MTKPMPVEITTFGSVEPYATVAVKAQVGGTLDKVHFQKGKNVKKGELLFTIDPRPYKAALEEAQANLARDRVREENAKKDFERETALLKKGISAQSDYDKASTEAAADAAAVRADVAAVETANLQLEHCSICSPIDGRTGNLLVNEGNLVKENADLPLVTINQVRPIEVSFSIPQRDLPSVKKNMAAGKLAVRAALPNEEGVAEVGELTFVDNAMDRMTGTVQLRAKFDNASERLWPGQYVSVTMTLAMQDDAIVAPSSAVQVGRDGHYVFVIKPDNTAEFRPVTVRRIPGDLAVIEKGLQPGERVATDGQLRLVQGAKVEIKNEGQKKTAAQGVAS